MTSTSNFFDVVLFFSYGSKFHVNIITGSGIMTIFFYKGLTRNPEIGNTHVWVFPNIWRLGRVIDTTFGTNVTNRMLLNAAKFHGYSFYHFWIIKGKPTGVVKLSPTAPPPRPRLGLNIEVQHIFLVSLNTIKRLLLKRYRGAFRTQSNI